MPDAAYPAKIHIGDRTWERRDDCAAVPDTEAGQGIEARLPGEGLCVVRGAQGTPVYALAGGPDILVPTGRVFVRLESGLELDQRREEFGAAGYAIDEPMKQIGYAGWLTHRDGAGAALDHATALQRVPGVENVEPEMLAPRAFR